MYDLNIKEIRKNHNSIVFIFLFIVSLAIIGVMLYFYIINAIEISRYDGEVKAISVDENSYYNDNGVLMYAPIYEYSVDGESYQCYPSIASTNSPTTENSIVYYDTSDPSLCMVDYEKSNANYLLFLTIIPFLALLISLIYIIKDFCYMNKVKSLNKNGILIKNVPFIKIPQEKNTKLQINYTIDGNKYGIITKEEYDNKSLDGRTTVDILVDKNDLKKYYVALDINRKSGNLDSDYYGSRG